MAKDKKKKKDKKSAKSASTLKTLAQNPLVADIVASALVATAAALKDSKRARALASDAGEELAKLSRAGSERGNALWEMAVQIGKRSLDTLIVGDPSPKPAKKAKPKPAPKPKPKPKPTAKKSSKKQARSGSR